MALMNRESVIQTPSDRKHIGNNELKRKKFERFCDNFYGEFLGSNMCNADIQDVCERVLNGRMGAMR